MGGMHLIECPSLQQPLSAGVMLSWSQHLQVHVFLLLELLANLYRSSVAVTDEDVMVPVSKVIYLRLSGH